MSATVLSRSYNESPQHHHFLVAQGGLEPRSPGLKTPATAIGGPRSSSIRRERPKMSGSGMRISFASDTRFVERPLRSRNMARSAATSYNLRPVQGSEKPVKVKVRLPRATKATGFRHPSASEEEYLNPRKAVDIAKSYGIPKYFLRGNTQVLTDGRMRLFGDNVWKRERTSLESDRLTTADSSDVTNRLIDSVDKAIATTRRKSATASEDDSAGLKLEIISLKSGADDKASSVRGSVRSLQGAGIGDASTVSDGGKDGTILTSNSDLATSVSGEKQVNFSTSFLESSGSEAAMAKAFKDIRPHTVDTTAGILVRYLPKIHLKEGDVRNSGSLELSRNFFNGTPLTPMSRSRQLASPFRGVSNSLDDNKYQNVLPRFYPAVSAHRNRQAEAERTGSRGGKKKGGNHRLVRFAETPTVRFSNESPSKDPITGLVAHRAPVQSVQRSLDSHSGLSVAEKYRRQKDIPEVGDDFTE